MLNYNVPTDTTGSDEEEYNGEGDMRAVCIALSLILLMLACIICFASIRGRVRPNRELSVPAVERQLEKDEKRKQRKEWMSKKLIVREWSPDDATVDTKISGENLTTDEQLMLESAPPRRDCISCELGTDDYESENLTPEKLLMLETAPPRRDCISCELGTDDYEPENLTPDEQLMLESAPPKRDCISCELGTDDYESFLDEAPGCAICLSHFKPHQLVCESNNLSCGHIFHQDCMMGWLMKHRMCPLCRQVYLLKTV